MPSWHGKSDTWESGSGRKLGTEPVLLSVMLNQTDENPALKFETFEDAARACGDALLVIRRGGESHYIVAHARLGDWAVTPAVAGDIPLTSKRKPSKTRTYVITHAPSGWKLGSTMARKEAFETLLRLAPIAAQTRAEIEASVSALWHAFPDGRKGSIPEPGSCVPKVRSDYENSVQTEIVGGYAD